MRNVHPRLRAKSATASRDWYRIENKKDDTARIDVYDAIGYDPWWDEGIAVADFAKEVRAIKASKIELHINSPGGAAFDGVTMYNAVRDHPAFVEVTVDGLAASAASVLAMSGDEIVMNRASELMIHDASGMCWGNADDMAETGSILDRLSADIAAIYADRAGGTVTSWRDAMREETWYSANEAVEAGLAHRIVELKEDAIEAKNRFDLRIFAHAGRSHAPAPKLRATSPELTRDNVLANKEVVKPEDGMTPEQLEVIGLPEDATDEQVSERLTELAQIEANANGEGDETPDPEAEPEETEEEDEDEDEETSEPSTEPQNLAVPPGTVLLDEKQYENMQSGLADLAKFREEQAIRNRNEFLNAAQRAGKFPAQQRAHYEGLWAINADQTRNLVDALAANTVPVEEIGHGGGDVENKADEAYPAEWSGLLRAQKVKA